MHYLQRLHRHRSTGFLVQGEVRGLCRRKFLKAFQYARSVGESSSNFEFVGGETVGAAMVGVVAGLEEEVELEVYEAKGLELLVVGGVELVDDETELGEGDAHEVHESLEAVAGFWRGESSDVSGSRSHGRSVGRHGRDAAYEI